MSKRKEIKMNGGINSAPINIQWVGLNKPGKYIAYLRLESEGQYKGALTDAQAKRLMRWLNQYYGAS